MRVFLVIFVFVYSCNCVFLYLCICESKSLEGPLVLPADPGQWSHAGIPGVFVFFVYFCTCVFVYLCICESKSLEGPLVLPADPGHVREFLMIFPLISNKLFRFSPQTRTRRRPVSFFLTYLARTTCFPGLKSRQLN